MLGMNHWPKQSLQHTLDIRFKSNVCNFYQSHILHIRHSEDRSHFCKVGNRLLLLHFGLELVLELVPLEVLCLLVLLVLLVLLLLRSRSSAR